MDFLKLRKFLDYMVETRSPGCAVTVYHKNQKVYEYATGVSSIETQKPLVGDEYFNIYSCSKILTVTAALTLLEKGKFLLSDPLYEYIPEFAKMNVHSNGTIVEAKNPITIGDLFTMTAGFTYNTQSDSIKEARKLTDGRMETDVVTRCLAKETLSFEPGTHWQYSLCHDILAGLVSIIEGKPFRDYVKETIFEPLDMTETVFHATPEIEAKMAEQYVFSPKENKSDLDIVKAQINGSSKDGSFTNVGKRVSLVFGPEYDSGGAGITATCGDYAKFLAALANKGLGLNGNRIISSATVDLMKVNRLKGELMTDYNWKALIGYGYGLGVRTHIAPEISGSNASLGEFGWGGAAGSTAIIDTDRNLALFFVQHTLNPREDWYQPRLRNVVYSCID